MEKDKLVFRRGINWLSNMASNSLKAVPRKTQIFHKFSPQSAKTSNKNSLIRKEATVPSRKIMTISRLKTTVKKMTRRKTVNVE